MHVAKPPVATRERWESLILGRGSAEYLCTHGKGEKSLLLLRGPVGSDLSSAKIADSLIRRGLLDYSPQSPPSYPPPSNRHAALGTDSDTSICVCVNGGAALEHGEITRAMPPLLPKKHAPEAPNSV